MPITPKQRTLLKGLEKATKEAGTALQQAASEVSPAQTRQLGRTGFSPTPVLTKAPPAAFVTSQRPARVFFGTREGKLTAPSVLGTARHEISHLLGAGHPAIAAAGGSRHAGELGTARGLVAAPRAEALSSSGRLQLTRARNVREGKAQRFKATKAREKTLIRGLNLPSTATKSQAAMSLTRGLVPSQTQPPKTRAEQRLAQQGFQTPRLLKASMSTSLVRRQEARTKMRKLGRRLKGRIDF